MSVVPPIAPTEPRRAKTRCREMLTPHNNLARVAADEEPQSGHSELNLGIADTQHALFDAFRLVYDVYVESRLAPPNPFGMRITPHHLVPDTNVFVATRQAEVVCTMSLVRDGRLGLPMESVYGPEVERCRMRGKMVAEVSCLAGTPDVMQGSRRLAVRLMGFMAQHAWRSGVDELLIAVHPDHADFYRRMLAFEPIGPKRHYSVVCNKPAVALALDLTQAAADYPRLYRRFFKQLYPDNMFQYGPISPKTLDQMRQIVEATDVTESAFARAAGVPA